MDRHLGTMLRELAKLDMDHGFSRPATARPRFGRPVRRARDRRSGQIDRRTRARAGVKRARRPFDRRRTA